MPGNDSEVVNIDYASVDKGMIVEVPFVSVMLLFQRRVLCEESYDKNIAGITSSEPQIHRGRVLVDVKCMHKNHVKEAEDDRHGRWKASHQQMSCTYCICCLCYSFPCITRKNTKGNFPSSSPVSNG